MPVLISESWPHYSGIPTTHLQASGSINFKAPLGDIGSDFVNFTVKYKRYAIIFESPYQLLEELDLSYRKHAEVTGSHYEGYLQLVMVRPRHVECVDLALHKKIAAHLATNYAVRTSDTLKFIPQEMLQWGKLKITGDGDMIHLKDLVVRNESSSGRDMTFVKYSLAVDQNGCYKNRLISLQTQVFYGWVLRFIAVPLPSTFSAPQAHDHQDKGLRQQPPTLLLATIATIKPITQNELGMVYYERLGPVKVVDTSCIQCVVRQIKDCGEWAVFEQNGAIRNTAWDMEDTEE